MQITRAVIVCVLSSFLNEALAQTSVSSAYVDQVLNARGQGALNYVGQTIDVDSVLSTHAECSKCSSATPCGHKSVLGVGSCTATASRQVIGGTAQYCAGSDVCCGGACRNSHIPIQKCSYLSTNVKTELDAFKYSSALDSLAYITSLGAATASSSFSDLTNSIFNDAIMAPRCTTNCNGWNSQGSVQPVACASSCGCTAQSLTTFQSGSTFVCELKPTSSDSDSFFSTGDSSLTASSSFGSSKGKAVCPSGYICNSPSTCITYDAYVALGGTGTSSTTAKTSDSGLSTSAKVGVGVGVSVAVLATGAAAAFFLRRKKLHQEDASGYRAMHENGA
ncbi:hypothetical protein THRCLA_08381 [Thraustotheca clavata]|uniref:Secreted protein n=1 Tax=Thraustotheca clavata TaxID=74557 RepID=A0A1V9Z6U7_9STRA|nr:hypothetical protein THRCLA_08381 [Thraustotheca clavata]